MEKLEQLYNELKPIVDLIEEKKATIYELIYEIEFDSHLPDKQWKVSENIGSALLELSLNSGDTAMKELEKMIKRLE